MQIREFAQPSVQPGHARAQDGARASADSALSFKHAGSALQNASEELTQSLSGKVMERALKERRITPGLTLAFIPKQKVHSLLHQIRDAKKSSDSVMSRNQTLHRWPGTSPAIQTQPTRFRRAAAGVGRMIRPSNS